MTEDETARDDDLVRLDSTQLSVGADARSASIGSESCGGATLPTASCASSPSHSLSGTFSNQLCFARPSCARETEDLNGDEGSVEHSRQPSTTIALDAPADAASPHAAASIFQRRVYLIRHAESAVNAPTATTQAVFDPPLSATGAQQARALGHAADAMRLDALLTSTLRRALDTAVSAFGSYVHPRTLDYVPVVGPGGVRVPVVALDELREVVGAMQIAELRRPVKALRDAYPGVSFAHVAADRIDPMAHFAVDLATSAPGPGERHTMLRARARRVAWLLLHGLPASCRAVGVVSHYHLLQWVVEALQAMGAPVSAATPAELVLWGNTQVVAVDMTVGMPQPAEPSEGDDAAEAGSEGLAASVAAWRSSCGMEATNGSQNGEGSNEVQNEAAVVTASRVTRIGFWQ